MESQRTAIERALELAEACQCNVTKREPNPDLDLLVACLRALPADQLLLREWITNEFCDFPWTPVVDGYFFVEDPKTSLARGNFKKSEVLVGSNLDEVFAYLHGPF